MTRDYTPEGYFRKPDISMIDPNDPIFDLPLSAKVMCLVDSEGKIVEIINA